MMTDGHCDRYNYHPRAPPNSFAAPGRLLSLGLPLEPAPLPFGTTVVYFSLGFLVGVCVLAGREIFLEHQLVELRWVLGYLRNHK